MIVASTRAAVIRTLVLALGCGSGACAPPPPVSLPEALVFSEPPIAISAVRFVVPMGNLDPPDHTLPTDHAYFFYGRSHHSEIAADVFAPAPGIVRQVTRGADGQVRIQATRAQTYYLDHLIVDAAIKTGMTVATGQRLGVVNPESSALDLGLVNDAVTLGFVNPSRYSGDTLHADSPLRYFREPVRGTIYGKERGTGANPDGKIDFDQAGRLVGNWFLEGVTGSESTVAGSGARQLAFARDVDDPAAVRIAIGGTLSMTGVYAVAADAPDPATILPGVGKIGYRLFRSPSATGPAAGLLLVEMLDVARIRVEAFAGSQARSADFTANAAIYVR